MTSMHMDTYLTLKQGRHGHGLTTALASRYLVQRGLESYYRNTVEVLHNVTFRACDNVTSTLLQVVSLSVLLPFGRTRRHNAG